MNAITPKIDDLTDRLQADNLQKHITYAGPHPVWDGWQVKFLFGSVHVSVAYTQHTEGVEMLAYDVPGWDKPRTYMNTDEIKTYLLELMQTHAQENPMPVKTHFVSNKETQVIVDETAEASLELLDNLSILAPTDRIAEGIYVVHATEREVNQIADRYPRAVIKVDAL